MRVIREGAFEVFATKADAIERFRKLQGVCREPLSDEKPIQFYCSRKGKITITNPPTRHVENSNSTSLFAEITERDGKTYVTYRTAYSGANRIFKLIALAVSLVMSAALIALSIASAENKIAFVLFPVLGLAFFAVELISGVKEEKHAPKDADIMIRELEKRVQAVNLWDK